MNVVERRPMARAIASRAPAHYVRNSDAGKRV